MWFKLCMLLLYLVLLFVLSRVLEVIAWCESGFNGSLPRQLLDPMVLSVVKLKALLENRGVSYEGIVEKAELSALVNSSGEVSSEEVDAAQSEDSPSADTNFTSGAHFIEQVEDAKDSVWLVQVLSHSGKHRVLSESGWKNIRRRVSKFGVRTGMLDCSLDARYCYQKRWHSPFLLLAMPSQFEKKASVAMYNYSGPVKETTILRWMRDRLDERISRIKHPEIFLQDWMNFRSNALTPEVKAVMFTDSESAPLFFSALSVKFPGRVKFGLVPLSSSEKRTGEWKDILAKCKVSKLPAYVIFTAESSYEFGSHPGEMFSFSSMELFLKSLYPCLNDIFILSFCLANVVSWLELFVCNCGLLRRIRKFFWCLLKYNIAVIMLWLPVIGIFQMPYLDRVPLLALKFERILSVSYVGQVFRGDYSFFNHHLTLVSLSFSAYLAFLTFLCKNFRHEDEEDSWFNFSQMRTLTHLRSNEFFEPMRIGGYDLMGGFEVFGSRLSQPSLWLQPSVNPEYIQRLPTWRYCPTSLATRAAHNAQKIEQVLIDNAQNQSRSSCVCREQKCLCSFQSKSHHDITCVSPSSCSCRRTLNGAGLSEQNVFQNTKKQSTGIKTCCKIDTFLNKQPDCVTTCANSRSKDSSKENWKDSRLSCSCFSVLDVAEFPAHGFSSQPNYSTCKYEHNGYIHTASFENITESSSQKSHADLSPPVSDAVTLPCESSPLSCGSNHQTKKESTSNFPEGYLESHQCVICLEEYISLTMLCGLPCGHVFHETCIISWLNREKHFCPMCRWPSHLPRALNPAQ